MGAAVERDRGASTPVHIPYGATRYVAIGSVAGFAEDFVAPDVPEWLAATGLIPQTFEGFFKPPVAWVLLEWRYRGWDRTQVSFVAPSRATYPAADELRWANLVLGVGNSGYGDDEWAAYVALATEIRRG